MTYKKLVNGLVASVVIVLLTCCFSYAQVKNSADLVVLYGKVVTLNPFRPHVEAVAVSGHTIMAVGTNKKIKKLVGQNTRVINAKGMLVVPGFIEGHGHLMQLGKTLGELNSSQADSWSDVVQNVKKAVAKAKPGEWILGHGWIEEHWDHPPKNSVNGWPTNTMLNKVSPDNPVMLTHSSGHALIANKKAMEIAGITANTKSPPGGKIVRNKNGQPIGIFIDNAESLIKSAYQKTLKKRSPQEVYQDRVETLMRAAKDAISHGITSFKAQSSSPEMIKFYKKLNKTGKLPLRIYAMVNAPYKVLKKILPKIKLIGHGNWFLTVRAIGEEALDGALGTHSAHFIKPYKDLPSSNGIQVTPVSVERKIAELAIKYGYQMAVHAIGDLANRQALNIYHKVFLEHPAESANARWVITHAQHLNPKDIPRFAKYGIIASMQEIHACMDGVYVNSRIGRKRARQGAYAWHKLIEKGTVVTNGTDTPVVPINPIPNYRCAVTRQLRSGKFFWSKEDMTRMQALKAYTINNAYSMFAEDNLGSITVGNLADITILSKDLLTIPFYKIDETNVVYTIIGGKVKYDHGEFENF